LSGIITVNQTLALNFELYSIYSLEVEVQDDGIGNLTDQATITIIINDVNEVPEIQNQMFSTDENSPNGMEVGIVVANDPDIGQSLTYSIINGNTDNAFLIDNENGTLSISNEEAFDFETNPVFNLTIEVQDDGPGNLTAQAEITVNLEDINEIPEIEDQYFTLEEFSPEGTEVGTVIATDPDNGQSLTYTIVSGNIQDAFSIDPNTGIITVLESAALNMSVNPVFILEVEVEDNGQGNLTDQATVVVALIAPTSVDESAHNIFMVNIFPNPVNEYMNITFDNVKRDELVVKVINFQGKIIYKNVYSNMSPTFEDKINVSEWGEGLYIVSIHNGDIFEQKKLIKL